MRKRCLALLLLACACSGTENRTGNPGGTLVISTGGDPEPLVPPLVSLVQTAQMVDLIYDRLADIGDKLNIVNDGGFTPRLADRWTWSADSLSIAFHIDPRARWHDGQRVTSSDVRFTFEASTDSTLGSSVASVLGNIDSVTTPDSASAVFWFHARTPQQFYDAVYQLPIMPEHIWASIPRSAWRASEQAKHPVGSGPYRFVRWTPRAFVELAADAGNYRGAPKIGRVIWSIAPNFTTALTRFTSGETDFFENLRPENLVEVAKHPELRTKQYSGLSYLFVQFNLRDPKNHNLPHPIFGDREVRRALTMAVDRSSIVRNVFDSLAVPALGPTVRAYPTTDTGLQPIPFDPARARQILDSLGWRDTNGDGIRERNGRPLQFGIIVPSTSKTRVQTAVLVQEQLRQVGAKVDVEQLELPTVVDRDRKRTFDATIGQWNTQPSPGAVRGSWGTAGSRASSGNNYGSYESRTFDAYVDSALASFDDPTRKSYFSKAYQTIIGDAPAIWIAELKPTVGYHSRLNLAPLRSDAWWAHIPEWSIPADKRIPRDNTPVLPTAASSTPAAPAASQPTPPKKP